MTYPLCEEYVLSEFILVCSIPDALVTCLPIRKRFQNNASWCPEDFKQ